MEESIHGSKPATPSPANAGGGGFGAKRRDGGGRSRRRAQSRPPPPPFGRSPLPHCTVGRSKWRTRQSFDFVDRRRGLGRLRAGQPAVGRSGAQGVAAGGGGRPLDSHPIVAVPLAWTTADDDAAESAGATSPSPRRALTTGPIPQPQGKLLGRHILDQRHDVRPRPGGRDYDSWAQMGLPGWSYAQGACPYFRRAESNWRGCRVPITGPSGPLNVAPQPRDPFLTPKE